MRPPADAVALQPLDPARPLALGDALPLREVVAVRAKVCCRWCWRFPMGASCVTQGCAALRPCAALARSSCRCGPWGFAACGRRHGVCNPTRNTGFFENAEGLRLQPGFKVGVDWLITRACLATPTCVGPLCPSSSGPWRLRP